MKKLILAGISMAALAAALQPASAADLPVAYRAPQSYVIFTWTGFYFGAHGGGAWGSKDTTIAPFTFAGATIAPPGTTIDVSGGLAGGQFGANYQAGSWVLGVELDASWADLTGGTRAVRFTDGTGLLFLDTSIRERVHVAKVGINYRFGWAPVGVIY
jgi:outer membrane immunogenic protein